MSRGERCYVWRIVHAPNQEGRQGDEGNQTPKIEEIKSFQFSQVISLLVCFLCS
jgi:hypothetical protein